MTTPQDTFDALLGQRQGYFEDSWYSAEFGFASDDLSARWEIIAVDHNRENDLDWEYRLYQYLNASLFPKEQE